jgi:hypothetical protein
MRSCACLDWYENIKYIDSVFTYAYLHGVNFNIKIFEYCPYCSAKLKEDIDYDNNSRQNEF